MMQEELGRRIAKFRKEKNLTQKELAESMNVEGRTVSRWENGTTLPDIFTLKELTKVLDVSILDLLQMDKKKDNGENNINEIVLNTIELYQSELSKQKNIQKKKGFYYCFCFIVILIIFSFGVYFGTKSKYETNFYTLNSKDKLYSINGYMAENSKRVVFMVDGLSCLGNIREEEKEEFNYFEISLETKGKRIYTEAIEKEEKVNVSLLLSEYVLYYDSEIDSKKSREFDKNETSIVVRYGNNLEYSTIVPIQFES